MHLIITLRHKTKKGMNIEYAVEIGQIKDFILELINNDPEIYGSTPRISLKKIGTDLLYHYQNIEGIKHYLGE